MNAFRIIITLVAVTLLGSVGEIDKSVTKVQSGDLALETTEILSEPIDKVTNDDNVILWLLGNQEWSISNIVGASTETGWINDEYEVASTLNGNEVYSVYSTLNLIDTYSGSYATETGVLTQEVELHKANESVNVFAEYDLNNEGALIALESNWNAKPREIVELDLMQTDNVKLKLNEYGFSNTEYIFTNIKRVYELDLDNDGNLELIVFESNNDLSNFHDEDIELARYNKLTIVSKRKDANFIEVINENYKPDEYWYLMYTGINFLDLDGDGTMEVIVESTGSEEDLLSVFTFMEDRVIEVLSCFYGV